MHTLTLSQDSTQVLRCEEADPAPAGTSGTELAPELLREAVDRLAIVCLAHAAVYAISFGAGTYLGGAPYRLRHGWPPQLADALICAASVLLSLAFWAWIRHGRQSVQGLLGLSGVYEAFGALGIELGRFRDWGIGLYDGISWSCVWILFFSVVVPMPRRRALAAALAAATMGPVAYALMVALGAVQPRHEHLASALTVYFLPNYLSAALAVVASQVVFRLGRDASRARQMGSYELVEKLGSGGMGEVWLARHQMLARPAAIKLIRPEALGTRAHDSGAVLQRFEWEAEATAALRSPHTIALYDFGRTDTGLLYYAMEHLQGLDLQKLVTRFGPLTAERVVYLLDQALLSLAEAHGKGLLHRDIKPSNLFLTEQAGQFDWLKVLDFGLAKKMHQTPEAASGSAKGAVVGSPLYMAPERFEGEQEADARSDLYALGAVAYFLLAGHPVFDVKNKMQALIEHARTPPEPLRSRAVRLSAELDALVLRCLDKQPRRRFDSAEALRCALHGTPEWGAWTQADARLWWEKHLRDGAPAGPQKPAGQTS